METDPRGDETLGEQELWEFWLTSDPAYALWTASLERNPDETDESNEHRQQ